MSLEIKIFKGTRNKAFDEALTIRRQVFTKEQHIPSSMDHDGLDDEAIHALIVSDKTSIGTGRLVIEGQRAVLARIAILYSFRGNNFASLIVKALEQHARQQGIHSFELYPHIYLEAFYSKLGYAVDRKYKNNVAGHDLIRMVKNYD